MSEYAFDIPRPSPDRVQQVRSLTALMYALYGIGLFTGFAWLIALVLHYLKAGEAQGTVYRSHFRWQIRTFWWGVFWLVLNGVGLCVSLGLVKSFLLGVSMFAVGLALDWLWVVYRLVRGFLGWIEHRKMPV